MEVLACADPAELARRAGALWLDRLARRPDLAMAVPAGRTPRTLYAHLTATAEAAAFAQMRAFAVDELCPPAPPDGHFWRQVRREFLAWARLPAAQCHPFRVDAPDLDAMCAEYEATIRAAGGLDLVMLGLGPNAHIASNEPGTPFDARTRAVDLLPGTVAYILTDPIQHGPVSARAVTLGIATLLEAREVVVLVSGEAKQAALRAMLKGPVTPAVPASALRLHPRCTVLADRAALGRPPA